MVHGVLPVSSLFSAGSLSNSILKAVPILLQVCLHDMFLWIPSTSHIRGNSMTRNVSKIGHDFLASIGDRGVGDCRTYSKVHGRESLTYPIKNTSRKHLNPSFVIPSRRMGLLLFDPSASPAATGSLGTPWTRIHTIVAAP